MPAKVRPPALQIVLRVALGIAAFFILWRFPEPNFLAIPSTDATLGQIAATPLSSLLLEVVVGAIAGGVFALAARPIWGAWTYRWGLPLALATIPAVIIAAHLLVFSGALPLTRSGIVETALLNIVSIFSLRVPAILLGVALAQGVVSDGTQDIEIEPSES